MRTTLKIVAGALTGFIGNLVPNALPERTVTVPDLVWAAATGLVVCLIVLAVTHARVWPKWAFEAQWPVRREYRSPFDEDAVELEDDEEDEESAMTVTGPPILVPTTPKVAPDERHFVDDSVTPHYLVRLLDGKTDSQAEVIARQWFGAWMPATGTVRNVMETGVVRVCLDVPDPPGWKRTGTPVGVAAYADFDEEWHDRARRLPLGATLTVVGSIARFDAFLGGSVTLEHAEIVPKQKAELSPNRGHDQRTARQAAEHRHFVDSALTTHLLLEEAKGMTSVQLNALDAEQIGAWIHADGKVVDVWEKTECVEVSLTAPGSAHETDLGRVIAHFDPEWRERAIRLPKGATVALVGRIASVEPNVEIIEVEHAEIVPPTHAPQ